MAVCCDEIEFVDTLLREKMIMRQLAHNFSSVRAEGKGGALMSVKEQLIDDIKQLPDYALQSLSIIVKEIAVINSKMGTNRRPIFGSGKEKMWIADDFDAPLEELREYME